MVSLTAQVQVGDISTGERGGVLCYLVPHPDIGPAVQDDPDAVLMASLTAEGREGMRSVLLRILSE